MTSITPKLTAAITTIALLAPVAGAQAASAAGGDIPGRRAGRGTA